MKKIVFFCIAAYGHTNPTIEIVRGLVNSGNKVWYYSFNEFKEKIEGAGATFISCDDYLPPLPKNADKIVGKDFKALMEMVIDTTMNLDEKVSRELQEINPDVIVSDSICYWGKLFAEKFNIKYICSTTTFAFNENTARLLKQGVKDVLKSIIDMKKVDKELNVLREKGYKIENPISMVANNNDTNTIVYTSKEFQPMADTFSDKFVFIGPSISDKVVKKEKRDFKKIYISLGTVNNKNMKFYQNCIKAFADSEYKIIMSVGNDTNINDFGEIPDNFEIKNSVKQVEVLQNVDLFISHSGMNSASESLYYGVPLLLYPQQSEQNMVATRVEELGAGLILKNDKVENIISKSKEIMNSNKYRDNAIRIGEGFRKCKGASRGVEFILNVIDK